jgi:hypothetical protein
MIFMSLRVGKKNLVYYRGGLKAKGQWPASQDLAARTHFGRA